jgi:hypothetical protein
VTPALQTRCWRSLMLPPDCGSTPTIGRPP